MADVPSLPESLLSLRKLALRWAAEPLSAQCHRPSACLRLWSSRENEHSAPALRGIGGEHGGFRGPHACSREENGLLTGTHSPFCRMGQEGTVCVITR